MAQPEMKSVSRGIRVIYSVFFISFLYLLFFTVSLFNEKARRGICGRKHLFEDLRRNLSNVPGDHRIWFHASSLGEFEQAKPIVEILKNAGYHIIVSFFSPSGYEYSKNYKAADVISYIPLDSAKNARRFVALVKPCVVVVMRYDLWLNHLIASKEAGARIIVADATFPMKLIHHPKFLKDFFRELYGLADEILVTTQGHKRMFDSFLRRDKSIVVGDTRFDRVHNRSVSNEMSLRFPVPIDKAQRTVLVLGSTWHSDMEVIEPGVSRLTAKYPNLTVIIVPHEPGKAEVDDLLTKFPAAKAMSELENHRNGDLPVVIVDRVGLLTQLYVLADVAFVGGGFGAGVHSVLEPAVYGVPIITGPRIERSDEALELHKNGALFFVKNRAEAYHVFLKMVGDTAARKNAGSIAKEFVNRNLGASQSVAEKVKQLCDGKIS